MRILVAGATGAIGRPLVALLQEDGHAVAALARSPERVRALEARGVEAHVCDVFDATSVHEAVARARPDVLVDQLTAIPQTLDIRRYEAAIAPTSRLRREATPHLMTAARATGVRRVVCQSISFVTAPEGPWIHDEDAPVYLEHAPRAFADAVRSTHEMEQCVLHTPEVEGVVLRYGFFYGPGTAYGPGGGTAAEIARRRFPVVGRGDGVSSFVHIDDAATATVLAVTGGAPGVYNVCDDEPAAMRDWLPVAAAAMGARRPFRVPTVVARLAAGPHAVHFGTTLRGNANGRFKAAFGWAPAHPSWRQGFPEVFAATGAAAAAAAAITA